MSSFVSEFLVLAGTFAYNKTVAVIATFGIVLAAVYILWMYQRTMTGEPTEEIKQTISEINKRELVAISPLIAVIIALGFVPQVALNVINPAVSKVQDYVDVQDSQPAIKSMDLVQATMKVGA